MSVYVTYYISLYKMYIRQLAKVIAIILDEEEETENRKMA